jgi:hypothetical protein
MLLSRDAQQLPWRAAVIRIRGDATGDGHRRHLVARAKVFGNAAEQAFGPRAVSLREDHRKLIAAESRRRVGGAARLPDGVRNADERPRTRAVSTGVVDPLQAVNVDDEDRKRALRPVRSRDLVAQDAEQAPIVSQAREGVSLGEIREARPGASPIGGKTRDHETDERHRAQIGRQAQDRLERRAPDEGTETPHGRDRPARRERGKRRHDRPPPGSQRDPDERGDGE